jgi:hypothetical protein
VLLWAAMLSRCPQRLSPGAKNDYDNRSPSSLLPSPKPDRSQDLSQEPPHSFASLRLRVMFNRGLTTSYRRTLHDRDCRATLGRNVEQLSPTAHRQQLKTIKTIVHHQSCSPSPKPDRSQDLSQDLLHSFAPSRESNLRTKWHDAPPSFSLQTICLEMIQGFRPTIAERFTTRDCRATMGPQCRAVVLNGSRQELKTNTTIVHYQTCSLRPSPIAARIFRKIHHTPLRLCVFA